MLDDILSETPLAKYLEEQGGLKKLRQALNAIVLAHYPDLLALAQQQGERIMDTTTLNLLLVQISIAQTEEDARQYLLGIA